MAVISAPLSSAASTTYDYERLTLSIGVSSIVLTFSNISIDMKHTEDSLLKERIENREINSKTNRLEINSGIAPLILVAF